MARSLRPALLFLALAAGCGGHKAPTSVVPVTTSTSPTAEPVRDAFLHAWQGYRRYAWGHDDLDPLSRKPHDWYGVPLLMTPVDAYDTMLLMGLGAEAADAKRAHGHAAPLHHHDGRQRARLRAAPEALESAYYLYRGRALSKDGRGDVGGDRSLDP